MADQIIRLDFLSFNAIGLTVDWRGFRVLASNLPERRAGIYLIVNLVNGKIYIGVSEDVRRRLTAHSKWNSPKKLKAAIRKHGKASFLVLPLFYSTGDATGLEDIEAALIGEHNAIGSGYNLCAAKGRVGPYGTAHCAAVRAGITHDSRARRAENGRRNYPASSEAFQAGRDAYIESPQGKAEMSARTEGLWRDLAYRAATTAAIRVAKAAKDHGAHSEATKRGWVNADDRRRRTAETFVTVMADPEVQRRSKAAATAARVDLWADPVRSAIVREKMTASQLARWARRRAAKRPE